MDNLKYTEEQRQTLYDVLDAGLEEYQIIDILDLLKTKPYKVQMAFYYRACGMTYEEIGREMSFPLSTIYWLLTKKCTEIKKYLTES